MKLIIRILAIIFLRWEDLILIEIEANHPQAARGRHRMNGVPRQAIPRPRSVPEPEVRVPAGYTLTVDHQGERLYARSPLPAWAGTYRHPYANDPYGDILV